MNPPGAALASSLLEAAVEHSADAVLVTDLEGVVVYANPALVQASGWARHELEGRPAGLLRGSPQDAEAWQQIKGTLREGRTWRGGLVNRRKDGSLYRVEASISPVRSASGEVTHFVALERDLTVELQLREQLLQAQKMEAIGRLAGGVAHDFNNLISAIQGYSEMVMRTLPPASTAREDLAEVLLAARRAAALTRRLMLFSRKHAAEPRTLDLRQLAAEMERMLRRLVHENVRLQLDEGAGEVLVRADPAQLEQVLLNLVVNAADSMPEGGLLRIRCSSRALDRPVRAQGGEVPAGRWAVLEVQDAGVGMSEEVQRHLFEPFFTTKEKGTGFGLATVFGVVRAAGGHVSVTSAPGQGSTFRVWLPETSGAASCEEEQREEAAPPGGTERIWVVEDDPRLRAVCVKLLRELGYDAAGFADAEGALEALGAQAPPELLVSDVMLPGLDGMELARKVAAATPAVRVLYVSGYSEEAVGSALPAGALLQKPFSCAQLAHRVREALAQPPRRASAAARGPATAPRDAAARGRAQQRP